jgi:hypothetical protein
MSTPVIEIDLDTKVISSKQKIWVVHAGTDKRLLRDFNDKNIVALEFPGLDLDVNVLRNPVMLRQRIRYSEALKRARGLTNAGGGTITRALYSGAPANDTTIPLRVIRHMFHNMNAGDLVITPTGGLHEPVIFGEVRAPFNPNEKVRLSRYNFADANARGVRWLDTNATLADIPYAISDRIRRPPAVRQLARDKSTERLFDFAYKSYIKAGEGWSLISAPGYGGADPLALVAPTELVAFCVALYNASKMSANISSLSFDQIIAQYYDASDVERFGSKFASPGRFSFLSSDAALSVYVTAAVAALVLGASAFGSAQRPTVEIQNTAGGADTEISQSQMQLNYALNALGDAALKEALEKADTSRRQVNLKSDAKVRVKP